MRQIFQATQLISVLLVKILLQKSDGYSELNRVYAFLFLDFKVI